MTFGDDDDDDHVEEETFFFSRFNILNLRIYLTLAPGGFTNRRLSCRTYVSEDNRQTDRSEKELL